MTETPAAAPRTAAPEARMDAEYARRTYLLDGRLARMACPPCRTGHPCRPCQFALLRVEASALRLDHAAAEDAARKSVAYA